MKKRESGILYTALCLCVAAAMLVTAACSAAPPTPTAAPVPKAAATSTPAPAKPEVIRWKGQSAFPTNLPPYYGPYPAGQTGFWAPYSHWLTWFEQRTNGRVKIDVAQPGAVFPVAESDLAVGKRVVDIAFASSFYYGGRIPEGDIENGPFFIENNQQAYELWVKYGLFQALQEAYRKYNLYYLPVFMDATIAINTTFGPLNRPEDLKGKKLRGVGMHADYADVLGAVTVPLPLADVYMGLKLGTIDGYFGGISILETSKTKEVIKSLVIDPNMSPSMNAIIINLDSYNALPADIRDILQKESNDVAYAASSIDYNLEAWVRHKAEADYGVKVYNWSPEDKARLVKAALDKVMPKVEQKSPSNAKLMEIVKKQMRDYGRIK